MILFSAIFVLILVFAPLYRAIYGPGLPNRLLGVNMIGTKTIVVLLLLGIIYQRLDMFVDIAMGYALLNFVGSIALARYLEEKGL